MNYEKHKDLSVPDHSENCPACYGKGTRHDFANSTAVKCMRCDGTGKVKKYPSKDVPACEG